MRKIFIVIFSCLFISAALADTVYGPTTAKDTLWSIANKLRPEQDMSVQQVMLAIFCLNEHAFSSNNINSLEPGKVLTLPNDAYIYSIAKESAYLEAVQQNRQWKKAKLQQVNQRKKVTKVTQQEELISIKPEILVEPQSMPQSMEVEVVETVASPDVPANTEISFAITELNNRLTEIEEKNNVVQSQVNQLTEQLQLLEQSLEQLKQSLDHWDFLNKLRIFVQQIQQYLAQSGQPLARMLMLVGVVLVLLLLVIYLVKRRKNSVAKTASRGTLQSSELEPTQDEYDLMESKEGIAAKLNLARAYIDMGKTAEAKEMLHEALTNGNPMEQEEAKELLAKISK